MQRRMGYIFASVSILTYMLNTAAIIISHAPISEMLKIKQLYFLIYALCFFGTAKIENKITRIVQVFIVALEAMICLIKDSNMPFFGLSLMVLAILLAFGHGLFTPNMKYKLVASGAVMFSLFYFIQGESVPARIIRSIEYTGFIAIELFILWAIFKDKIEQLEYKGKSILGLANEAAKVAHEAIQLSKECGEGIPHG